MTVFNATERRRYERELLAARSAADAARKEVEALHSTAQAHLLDERSTAALREEFIAVLGHDLRNPLAAIDSGMHLLLRTPLNDRATAVVGMVQNSVGRMAGLIDNVMDFARGRLGGGLTLDRNADEPVEPVLRQVVGELRASNPDRLIDATISRERTCRLRPSAHRAACVQPAWQRADPRRPGWNGACWQPPRRRLVRAVRGQRRRPDTGRHASRASSSHSPGGRSAPACRASGSASTSATRSRPRTAARSRWPPIRRKPGSPSGCEPRSASEPTCFGACTPRAAPARGRPAAMPGRHYHHWAQGTAGNCGSHSHGGRWRQLRRADGTTLSPLGGEGEMLPARQFTRLWTHHPDHRSTLLPIQQAAHPSLRHRSRDPGMPGQRAST